VQESTDAGLGAHAVVLSGHSQGSLISVAALAVLDYQSRHAPADSSDDRQPWLTRQHSSDALPRMGFASYGSQLQFAYARLFPSYFGYGRLRWITDVVLPALPGQPVTLKDHRPLGRWRGFYRWTDPLGGPVLSWPGATPAGGTHVGRPSPLTDTWVDVTCPFGCAGEPITVVPDWRLHGVTHRWYHAGPDVRLVDPDVVVENPFEPRLAPRRHSDYPLDPVFDTIVADLLDETTAGTAPEPAPVPPSPSTDPFAVLADALGTLLPTGASLEELVDAAFGPAPAVPPAAGEQTEAAGEPPPTPEWTQRPKPARW
jgi:hypothetical protein